jgi:hypothetical protein
MNKHSVFAGIVMLAVGIIAFQTMRADTVAIASQAVSPFELMQNARDLPVTRNDNAV